VRNRSKVKVKVNKWKVIKTEDEIKYSNLTESVLLEYLRFTDHVILTRHTLAACIMERNIVTRGKELSVTFEVVEIEAFVLSGNHVYSFRIPL
jgi:hypothetical protein